MAGAKPAYARLPLPQPHAALAGASAARDRAARPHKRRYRPNGPEDGRFATMLLVECTNMPPRRPPPEKPPPPVAAPRPLPAQRGCRWPLRRSAPVRLVRQAGGRDGPRPARRTPASPGRGAADHVGRVGMDRFERRCAGGSCCRTSTTELAEFLGHSLNFWDTQLATTRAASSRVAGRRDERGRAQGNRRTQNLEMPKPTGEGGP